MSELIATVDQPIDGSMPLDYATALVVVLKRLENMLQARYLDRWRLRMERESPGVWRCHWDILTESGEVLGGGSESFTINL